MRILVIEDHPALRSGVTLALRELGWSVEDVGDLASGRRALTTDPIPGALILDRRLPDGDGIDLLRWMRRQHMTLPVLLLTSADSIPDRVEGLDAGADDYLVKPFALPELLARLRRMVRQQHGHHSTLLQVGDVQLDMATKRVSRAGGIIEVSPKEFQLLEHLILRKDSVVSRHELWSHIYDDTSDTISNVLDVLVGRLRRKLGNPPVIHTRRGVGFIASSEDASP